MWCLQNRIQHFPSLVAVLDLPLGGNLTLLQLGAWLLSLQRQKGVQHAWEMVTHCASLAAFALSDHFWQSRSLFAERI